MGTIDTAQKELDGCQQDELIAQYRAIDDIRDELHGAWKQNLIGGENPDTMDHEQLRRSYTAYIKAERAAAKAGDTPPLLR